MKYLFIEAEKDNFEVRLMCEVLGASDSAFYNWRSRRGAPDLRIPDDELDLRAAIVRLHRQSRGRYGRPRLAIMLRRLGFRVGPNRIRRIMRELSIEGRSGRKRKPRKPQQKAPPAPNHLRRKFDVASPNTVWAGDITELRVGKAKFFLAIVADLYSRRVVGWALSRSASAALVTAAMKRAVARRRPPKGLLFHSDQGTQYSSTRFRDQLRTLGIRQSMSRRANCWDNSPIESFFATVKKELVYTRRWSSREELERAINTYINRFYNTKRIHSRLGYKSPDDFERSKKAA